MRKFVALISVIFVLGLAISAGRPVDATSSDPTVNHNEVGRAKRQLEDATKDPERVGVLRCLGANLAQQPSALAPNDAQCENILAAAAGTTPSQTMPILKVGGVNGSPAARAYIETMVRFQISFETAYHAGICRLRSEGYFNTFRVAQLRLSQQEARRLKLSETEMARASAEVNRQVAELHKGLPDFDIVKGCDFLRNSSRMDEVDALHRRLTNNGY
ncbi:hypothetical protein [Tardiphaga robiniae]|uniref:hypothetical protein n=1 Tax=Tardiphaga robiniae TaxID=943830 RepID=UPI001112C650|nr:hypothetical protein [Tardiphaga robiniae]